MAYVTVPSMNLVSIFALESNLPSASLIRKIGGIVIAAVELVTGVMRSVIVTSASMRF
jgi:hypothetical protein